MMINNLKKLKKILEFKNDWFYEVLIMKRRKDTGNDEMSKPVKVIKTYMITSIDHLDSKMDEIIMLSEQFNARAYINPQPYSLNKLGFKIIETTLSMLQNKNTNYNGVVSKAIGSMGAEVKRWVIDIDFVNADQTAINRISTVINDCAPDGDNILLNIPTANGVHLITRPFNTQHFITQQDVYYKAAIKKDNPTLLYSNLKVNNNENK
jgi:hypothetical protein